MIHQLEPDKMAARFVSLPVALTTVIRDASRDRKTFLIQQLKQLKLTQKLKVSLEHHIEGMEAERNDVVTKASVVVTGCAHQNAVVQIGEVRRELQEDLSSVVFKLSADGRQVRQELRL